MSVVSKEHLNVNKDIWSDNEPFQVAYNKLSGLLESILKEDQKLATVTKGITAEKEKRKQAMLKNTWFLITNAKAYADSVGNEQLVKDLSYSESSLSAGTGQGIFTRCNNIYDLLSPIVTDMANFRITPERMASQKKSCDDFYAFLEAPAIKMHQRSAAVAQLDKLFTQLMDLFNKQLDALVAGYADTHPEFVLNYQKARYIGGYSNPKEAEPEAQG